MSDGSYTRCCGKDAGKKSSPRMIMSKEENTKLMADIRETVTTTVRAQMQAVAAEVVKDIRKELAQDFVEIRQSIDDIKASASV